MKYRNIKGRTNAEILNSWSKRNSSAQWINESRERGSWKRFRLTPRRRYHRYFYNCMRRQGVAV